MSGTSLDGLDIAVVAFAEGSQPSLLSWETAEFPDELATDLRALARSTEIDIRHLGATDAALGEFIGAAIARHLDTQGIDPARVQAIGSHGQTIHHAPRAAMPFTMQIGDASRIAEASNITVVADFRRADVAAGGEGAPLVPEFHAQVFASKTPLAIVNIGGIANATLTAKGAVLAGFDTGPGNTLMDSWARTHGQGDFDVNGEWAATGTPNPELLSRLLSDPWFERPLPRSTGPEHFNHQWLLTAQAEALQAADVQATLVQLTAASIVQTIRQAATQFGLDQPRELVLCGGGRRNPKLVEALRQHANLPVSSTDDYGVNGDQLEAMAFAWLARERLQNRPANAVRATGAAGPRLLGAIYPAPRDITEGRQGNKEES